MKSNKEHNYDVAFSFAGENRQYVDQVHAYLKTNGLKVFYDEAEEIELWGEDLVARFDEIYRKEAQYCVMFISKHYVEKAWPRHERRSALARMLTDEGYVLPTRFDDSDIPGLPPTIHYVDLRQRTPQQLGDMIFKKFGQSVTSSKQSQGSNSFRRPKVAKSFDPYKESQKWMDELIKELEKRSQDSDISFSSFSRQGKQCLRFVINGQPVYSIDMQLGGFHRDHGLTFRYAHGELHEISSSYNAWAECEWDKEKECVVLRLQDFSVFSRPSNELQSLTQEELFNYMWDKVCNAVEGKY